MTISKDCRRDQRFMGILGNIINRLLALSIHTPSNPGTYLDSPAVYPKTVTYPLPSAFLPFLLHVLLMVLTLQRIRRGHSDLRMKRLMEVFSGSVPCNYLVELFSASVLLKRGVRELRV
jgi:hypothetical protein